MNDETAPPDDRERWQRDAAAQFHELLDGAAAAILSLKDNGSVSAETIAELESKEATLRYQVRQLRAAKQSAALDIEGGMRLTWQRFADQLKELGAPVKPLPV